MIAFLCWQHAAVPKCCNPWRYWLVTVAVIRFLSFPTCEHSEVLCVFQVLQCVLGSAVLPLCSAALAPVTDEVYEKAENLFPCHNVTLKRDGDTVKTEIIQQPGHLPLVLCIAVKGLASLARDVWFGHRSWKTDAVTLQYGEFRVFIDCLLQQNNRHAFFLWGHQVEILCTGHLGQ